MGHCGLEPQDRQPVTVLGQLIRFVSCAFQFASGAVGESQGLGESVNIDKDRVARVRRWSTGTFQTNSE